MAMTIEEFVRDTENREIIDRVIKHCLGDAAAIDDEERENWVLNDEGLYNLADENGVWDNELDDDGPDQNDPRQPIANDGREIRTGQ